MLEMETCVGKHPCWQLQRSTQPNNTKEQRNKKELHIYIMDLPCPFKKMMDNECGAPIVGILDDAYNVKYLHIVRWRIQKPPCKPWKTHVNLPNKCSLEGTTMICYITMNGSMAGESQDRPLAPSFFLSVQPVSSRYHSITSSGPMKFSISRIAPNLRSCCLILFKSTMTFISIKPLGSDDPWILHQTGRTSNQAFCRAKTSSLPY